MKTTPRRPLIRKDLLNITHIPKQRNMTKLEDKCPKCKSNLWKTPLGNTWCKECNSRVPPSKTFKR